MQLVEPVQVDNVMNDHQEVIAVAAEGAHGPKSAIGTSLQTAHHQSTQSFTDHKRYQVSLLLYAQAVGFCV